MVPRIILIGIFYIVMIITGLLLSKRGRPLNTILFTIHKITAVLAIILTIMLAHKMQKEIAINPGEISVVAIAGICLAMTFISGALLSFDKLVHPVTSTIHKIFPYLSILSAAITFYLLT